MVNLFYPCLFFLICFTTPMGNRRWTNSCQAICRLARDWNGFAAKVFYGMRQPVFIVSSFDRHCRLQCYYSLFPLLALVTHGHLPLCIHSCLFWQTLYITVLLFFVSRIFSGNAWAFTLVHLCDSGNAWAFALVHLCEFEWSSFKKFTKKSIPVWMIDMRISFTRSIGSWPFAEWQVWINKGNIILHVGLTTDNNRGLDKAALLI